MYPQNSLSPFSQHTPQQGSQDAALGHCQAELLDDAIIPFHGSPGEQGEQGAQLKTVYNLPEPCTPPQLVPDASGAVWPLQQQSPVWTQGSPAPQEHHGHQLSLDGLENFVDVSLSLQEGQGPQVGQQQQQQA